MDAARTRSVVDRDALFEALVGRPGISDAAAIAETFQSAERRWPRFVQRYNETCHFGIEALSAE